ncbi:MAG: hypothetical protein WDN03_04870 [Rhizomicrobium sp.]
MRRLRVLIAAAAFVGPGADGLCADGLRYVAPNRAFSIAADSTVFPLDREFATGPNGFVVFRFDPATGTHGAAGERTVVWNALTALIPNSDVAALDFATGFLTERYPHGRFQIATKIKARTADGRLYYVFTAHGIYKDTAALWTGVVMYFVLKGAGLAADVHTLNAAAAPGQRALGDEETVAWGTSLRPGP